MPFSELLGSPETLVISWFVDTSVQSVSVVLAQWFLHMSSLRVLSSLITRTPVILGQGLPNPMGTHLNLITYICKDHISMQGHIQGYQGLKL